MPVTLTPDLVDQLRAVNRDANATIQYRPNLPYACVPPGHAAIGDCKTFADSKGNTLVDLGWPRDSLSLGQCFAPTAVQGLPVEWQVNHCVLLVDTDQGVYVLSNGIDEPTPIDALPWTNWCRLGADGSRTEIAFEGEA